MTAARRVLAEVFGFAAFRPGQEAVIEALLAVKRLSILTPDRRAKLTPLSGTAEVVPVVNRGGTC